MSLPGFLSVMNVGGSRILWLCPLVDFHILLSLPVVQVHFCVANLFNYELFSQIN